jgi:hypothetical protein
MILLSAAPTAVAASPAQDGNATKICSTSATTCTTGTLTTTGTSDVLYLTVVVTSSTSGSSPTVSGVTSTPSLTWTHRQSVTLPTTTTGYCSSTRKCDLETWYTTDTSAFSGTVTVTATANARMSIVVFGISGANTAHPFDPEVSTACTGTATSGEPSCTLSTSDADDFIIGGAAWLKATTGGTAGAGFALIATTSTGGHVNALAEHDIVSSYQSNLAISIGSPTCSTTIVCGIIGDAVAAPTTTTVMCTPNPVDDGVTTTCTATTSPSAAGTEAFSGFGAGTVTGSPCTLSSGTCSVTYTPASGASSSQTITATYEYGGSGTTTITVYPTLVVSTPTATHNPVDVGQSVTFTASPSGGSGTYGTYSWSGLPTGCTASNSATITCTPSTTSGSPFSVTVAVTDSTGNKATSGALSETLDPALSAGTLAATHNPVDVSFATTMSTSGASGGSGTYTYSWTGLPSGCNTSNSASISCTPSSASGSPFIVTLTVSDGNGDTATATLSLTVDPAVTAAPSATHNPVDVSQVSIISASASGGSGAYTSYVWSGLPPGCSGSTASFSCTPASYSASPYLVQVVVTDSNGGTATKTFSLTVDPALSAGTLSAAHDPVDVGQATTISASGATGGTGAGTYSYSWTNLPPGCSSANTASISCTPSATTGSPFAVTLTVTDGNSNAATATLSLTVDSALTEPTPTVTHDPADVGQSVSFSALPSGGSGSYNTFAWSGLPTGCTPSNSATITCAPSTTNGSPFSVTVAVTDSNGNSVTSSALSFTVDPPLSAGILSATVHPVDVYQTTVISTSGATGGSGAYSYSWSDLPDGCPGADSVSISCAPSSTAGSPFTVTLIVTDGASNTATATLTLTVDPALTASPSATVNPVDAEQANTISAGASGGSGTYTSYVWSGLPPGCSGSTASFGCTPSSNHGSPFVAQVALTDSNGNTVTETFTLTVEADPTVTVTPAGPITYDVGQSAATLTATVTYSGPNTATVEWYASPSSSCSSSSTDARVSGLSFNTSTAPTGTTFYCAVVSDSGVSGYHSPSSAVEVTVYADPIVSATPSTSSFDVGQTSTNALVATVTYTGPNIATVEWFASSSGASCTETGLPLALGTTILDLTPSTSTAGTYYFCAQVTDIGSGLSLYVSYSEVATVIVFADPNVSVSPAGPLSYDAGQSAPSLASTVNYSGANTAKVEWYSSSTSSCSASSTDTGISGDSFAPSTSSTGTAYYCAVVSDFGIPSYGSSSNAVEVTVFADPTVTVAPAGPFTYDFGEAASELTATATHTGPNTASVEWYSSTSSYCSSSSIDTGVDGTSYTPGTTSTGTTYYCAVVSDSGVPAYSSASNAIEVTIYASPTVSVSPSTSSFDVGQTSTNAFTASVAYTGFNTVTVEWFASSSGASCTMAGLVLASGTSATLALTPSTSAAGTYYYCAQVTDNGAGLSSYVSYSDVVTLTVYADPTVSVAPAGPFAYDVGQTVTGLAATVSYTGPNNANVEWYTSPTPSCSASSTDTYISVESFTPGTTSTGTIYYCAVVSDSHVAGYHSDSNAVEVTVDPALTLPTPTVTHDPADVGQSVSFSALPSGGSGSYNTFAWSGLPTGCTPSNSATITCAPSTTNGSPFSVTVAVTDSNGNSVTSSALTFAVATDPMVSVAPAGPFSYDVGQTGAGLTATITYTGPNTASVQWYSSETSSCSSSSTDTGKSGLSLNPDTSTTGTTYYCAVVSDTGVLAYAHASNAVKVTVYADPSVSAAPVGPLTYDVGQTSSTLTATVTYNGPNTASVEWYSSTASWCSASSTDTHTSGLSYTPSTSSTDTTYYCAVVSDSGVLGYSSPSNIVEVTVNTGFTSPSTPGVSATLLDVDQPLAITGTIPNTGSPTYSWQWMVSVNGGSYAGTTQCATNGGAGANTGDAETCSIAANALAGGETYAFELEVADNASVPESATSSASSTVTVSPALTAPSIPSVSATALDANQALTVSGTIPTTGTPNYSWQWMVSFNGGTYTVATQCTTSRGTGATGGATETCSIPAGTLVAGDTYAFELTVTDTATSMESATSPASPTVAIGTVSSGTTPVSVSITLIPDRTSQATSSSNYFTISYTGSGGATTTKAIGSSPTYFWALPGSTITISSSSSGSNVNEKWCLNATCSSVTFSAPAQWSAATYTFYYYDLLLQSVSCSASGGWPAPPSLSYQGAPSAAGSTDTPTILSLKLSASAQTVMALKETTASVPSSMSNASGLTWTTPSSSWTISTYNVIPNPIVYGLVTTTTSTVTTATTTPPTTTTTTTTSTTMSPSHTATTTTTSAIPPTTSTMSTTMAAPPLAPTALYHEIIAVVIPLMIVVAIGMWASRRRR